MDKLTYSFFEILDNKQKEVFSDENRREVLDLLDAYLKANPHELLRGPFTLRLVQKTVIQQLR